MGKIVTEAELLPPSAADLRERAKELCAQLGRNFFELGEVLYEIKVSEAYLEWDYGSYVEYAENELGIKTRTAQHWIDIWETFHHRLGYQWDEIGHVGWAKLSRITKVADNRREANRWLKKAAKLSKPALEEAVRQHRAQQEADEPQETRTKGQQYDRIDHNVEGDLEGVNETVDSPFVDPTQINPNEALVEELEYEDEDTGESVPLHKFQVYLFGPQWANVMAAMERAGQLVNSEKACHLLDVIATEFNTAYAESEDGGVAHRLDYHVKQLERIYGVKIEVEVPAGSALRKMSRIDDAGEDESQQQAELKQAQSRARRRKKPRTQSW